MFHDGQYSNNDRIQPQVSTDGTTWSNVGPAIPRYAAGTYAWQEYVVDLSAYIGQANVFIGFLAIGAYGNDCHIDDVTVECTPPPPAISVVYPNGGEVLTTGDLTVINWTASGTVGNVKIEYSTNGGASYRSVTPSTPNDGAFLWIVPSLASSQGMIKVSETDGDPWDTSNTFFTVTAGQPSPANAVVSDFGALGLWVWKNDIWGQVSGANPGSIAAVNVDANGDEEIAGDFGILGLWLWNESSWTHLSGSNANLLAAANTDGDVDEELVSNFGALRLWLWDPTGWTQLSGASAEGVIPLNIDADPAEELAADFGAIGVWVWNGGAWSTLSALNPDSMIVADPDGDGLDEIVADVGALGLWYWNDGTWHQISAQNADSVISIVGDSNGL